MHIHDTLGKNTNEIDGQDIPRIIDAYATDAYYCIVYLLYMICVYKCHKMYAYYIVALIRMPFIFYAHDTNNISIIIV